MSKRQKGHNAAKQQSKATEIDSHSTRDDERISSKSDAARASLVKIDQQRLSSEAKDRSELALAGMPRVCPREVRVFQGARSDAKWSGEVGGRGERATTRWDANDKVVRLRIVAQAPRIRDNSQIGASRATICGEPRDNLWRAARQLSASIATI